MPHIASRANAFVVAGVLVGLSSVLPGAVYAEETPAAAPVPAPVAGDVGQRVQQLETTVRELQETIRRLQGAPSPAGGAPAAAPVATNAEVEKIVDERLKQQKPLAGWQDGFFLQSPDGDFKLRVRGYIQSDSRFFTSDRGDTSNDSFYLRRVRPIFDGTLAKNVDFRLMPDFGEGRTVLQDAYLDLGFNPTARVRVGKFKEPLSLERLQSGQDLLFVERSLSQNLAPNRDVGIQVYGDVAGGTVSYALGLFNGVLDAGSSDGDVAEDKDVAVRLFAQPFKNQAGSPLQGLGIGIAGTFGRKKESLSGETLRTAARSAFFKYDSTVTGDGPHTRLAPQFYYYQGPFGLLGEYITSRQRVREGALSETLTHNGWFVQTSFLLTGEKASFRSPTPLRPLGSPDGGRGAFELAARYSKFNADADTFRLGFSDPTAAAEDVSELTLGLNWYLNRGTKVQLNYEHTDFGRGLTFGTDTRDREDAVLSRFQVSF